MRTYLYVGSYLVVAALFFGVGYKVSSASYERKLKDLSEETIKFQNEAVIRHNKELEIERARVIKAQKERDAISQKAQRIIDEATNSSSIQWNDAQRLRVEELYRIYGYTN